MRKFFVSAFALLSLLMNHLNAQVVVGIYSNFDGFWHSKSSAINPVQPNNSHDLLAFTVRKGNDTVVYSTGVNDALLSSQSVNFVAQQFKALPVATLPALKYNGTDATNVIGVGSMYGGAGHSPTPAAVTNDVASYLIDGANGLDLGTGIFNMPASTEIYYTVSQIFSAAIGDGVPDILVTQIGQPAPSSNLDEFRFVDASGAIVGNMVSANTSVPPILGNNLLKFFRPSAVGTPVAIPTLNGYRGVRIIAFDFADFGITAADISQIKSFSQKFSGYSDQAFIAYNATSIALLQSISGNVFKDPDGGTPSGSGYQNATVELRDASGNVVATTTTDASGHYSFANLAPGTYSVTLILPAGYSVTGASDGETDNQLLVTVGSDPVSGLNFGIRNPALPIDFGEFTAYLQNDVLTINWQTLTETNSDKFEVEASADGTNFEKIGTIESKSFNGKSALTIDYTFQVNLSTLPDLLGIPFLGVLLFAFSAKRRKKNLSGLLAFITICTIILISCSKESGSLSTENKTIFVRLKQIDKDGSFKFSKTVRAVHK